MSRKITRGTRKHILWVNLVMLLIFVGFIILHWWVMALGSLIITMFRLFKESGRPNEEKLTHSSGIFSDRDFNKRMREFPKVLPVNIDGTCLVAVTYKDETGIGFD